MKQKIKIKETVTQTKEIEVTFPFYRYGHSSCALGAEYFHKILSSEKGIYIDIREDAFSDNGIDLDDSYEIELITSPLHWSNIVSENYGLNDCQEYYKKKFEDALNKITNIIRSL